MFPFQTSPNLSFQNFDTGDQFDQNNNNDTSEYLILPENNTPTITPNINSGKSRGRKSRASTFTHDINNNNNNNNNDYGKKIVHREIERQRRQEMSNLFASLRTILPAEYIRGKRSVSDHVDQAVKYIKDMEKNVKELGEKRDQLRKSVASCSSSGSSSRNNEGGGGSGSSNFLPGNVSIHHVKGGVEIEISVSSQDEGFSLASVLEVAFEEGLSVTSCSSTNVNGRLIHNLTCEVNNVACIDVYRLQQILMDLVC